MLLSRKKVELDGSIMSVVDVGSGPVLLLGHGWLCDAAMWASQIEVLSNSHRVIAPDMWGHGDSEAMPAGTNTLADLALQHLDLLDALGVDRFAVAGLSLGGMWGAELALLAPERVSSLVLMATSLAAEPAESRDAFLSVVDDIGQRRAISEAVSTSLASLLYSADFVAREPHLVEAHRARLVSWPADRLADSVVPIGRMIFNRRDALAELKTLDVPMLTVSGFNDLALPFERVATMANTIGSRFVGVSQAGHLLTLEKAGEINKVLQGFLTPWPRPPKFGMA